MNEIIFPGLTAQLAEEAKNQEEKRKYDARKEREQKTKANQLKKDFNYLRRSNALGVFLQAAALLKKGGHEPRISITNPEPTNSHEYIPSHIDLRLIWDVKSRLDSHPLIGSDDSHYDVYDWKEANCRLIRDENGKLIRLSFNIFPNPDRPIFKYEHVPLTSTTISNDIEKAVDWAVTHPLHLDEEKGGGRSPHKETYQDQVRINIEIP